MKILVYGWYHHANIGDDLIITVFRKLFPNIEFTFCDAINSASALDNVDAVFFGGGSFLLERPNISKSAFEVLKQKKIFYLGVGVESSIHPDHMELIQRAKLIATRSPEQIEKLQILNPRTILIPELVYSLQSDVQYSPKTSQSVLVLPNISVIPKSSDMFWKHASWMHFKSEFAQFLDWLVEEGYKIEFLSFCRDKNTNDDWIAGEIIGHMVHRGPYMIEKQPRTFEEVTALMSKYNVIITQRFHGIVLSEMVRTPYIAIHHHDKLKSCEPNEGKFLSYYNVSKHQFIEAFNQTVKMNFDKPLPIESNIFKALIQEVISLL